MSYRQGVAPVPLAGERTWAGEVRNVSLLAAIGVSGGGDREPPVIVAGPKEDKSGWRAFLKHLEAP